MRTIIFGLLLLAGCPPSIAGEPSAFSWASGAIPCNSTDQVVSLPNNEGRYISGQIGAGVMPPRPFKITKVEIIHWTSDPGAWAVVGKTGHGGDFVSRKVVGTGNLSMDFASDERPIFSDGDEFHIHAGCNGSRGNHEVEVNMRVITLP